MCSAKIELPSSGVKIIKEWEGCFLKAYPDPLTGNEPITIGWGSTRKRDGSKWELGDRISQQEADDLLLYQLGKNYLPKLQQTVPGWYDLTENQQGALLSFAWNLGASFFGSDGFDSISRMLRERNWAIATTVFLKYCNPGTSVEEGLRARRKAEAKLFLA